MANLANVLIAAFTNSRENRLDKKDQAQCKLHINYINDNILHCGLHTSDHVASTMIKNVICARTNEGAIRKRLSCGLFPTNIKIYVCRIMYSHHGGNNSLGEAWMLFHYRFKRP